MIEKFRLLLVGIGTFYAADIIIDYFEIEYKLFVFSILYILVSLFEKYEISATGFALYLSNSIQLITSESLIHYEFTEFLILIFISFIVSSTLFETIRKKELKFTSTLLFSIFIGFVLSFSSLKVIELFGTEKNYSLLVSDIPRLVLFTIVFFLHPYLEKLKKE